jgi:hypothetical protein
MPTLRAHHGRPLGEVLPLLSGVQPRTVWQVWGLEGQRLAADAMAQIRATPARPVREGLAEAVAFAEEERHARRVAAAQGGAP